MQENHEREILPYTDLAIERRRASTDTPGVEYTREDIGFGVWERIRIRSSEGAAEIGRPMGRYNTLSLREPSSIDNARKKLISGEIAKELISLIGGRQKRILIVGLGNRDITRDSLGPRVADRVKPTRHIRICEPELFMSLGCSEISVISPGVTAKTGLMSPELVRAVCDTVECEAVIAIDAIITRSYERLYKTVQLSDSGICPGSGLSRPEGALSKETLGVPAIAIGVPTVIGAKSSNPKHGSTPVTADKAEENVNSASQIIANSINLAFGLG